MAQPLHPIWGGQTCLIENVLKTLSEGHPFRVSLIVGASHGFYPLPVLLIAPKRRLVFRRQTRHMPFDKGNELLPILCWQALSVMSTSGSPVRSIPYVAAAGPRSEGL